MIKTLVEIRLIKVDLKKLRILRVSHDMKTIAEARKLHAFLHPYYAYKSGIKDNLFIIRTAYLNACRKNFPNVGKASTMFKLEHKHLSDDLTRDIRLLDRCLYFIQTSRVSRKHKYQEWTASTPKPVLPQYVRVAVESHRKEYGTQSIY